MILCDHCRIGSLEMRMGADSWCRIDHCRIGSLEIVLADDLDGLEDHCRIGSLEMCCGATWLQEH